MKEVEVELGAVATAAAEVEDGVKAVVEGERSFRSCEAGPSKGFSSTESRQRTPNIY